MYLTHSETGPKEANFPKGISADHDGDLTSGCMADFDGDVLLPIRRYHIKGKRRGLGKRGNRIQIVMLSGWLIYPVLKSIGEQLSDLHIGKV